MDSSSGPSSIFFPPRFVPGDTIGVCAPASPPDKAEKVEETLQRLAGLGFKVKTGKYLHKREGYLAGSDEERAEDFNALMADHEVKAVFALRGGYGSCRILPLLDYAAIRANPKPFIGFSDVTAMHAAIFTKTGLVTFHGQDAMKAFLPENDATCRRMLLDSGGSRRPPGDGASLPSVAVARRRDGPVILFSRNGTDRTDRTNLKTVVPGTASGRLLGGNMTCLERLIGTPYLPDFHDAILFLEDTGEKAYRVDGMFTHFRLAGILAQIRGLVLGRFDHTDAEEQRRIEACLEREAERIGLPCVSGAPIGHFLEQIIVPHGAEAELDADEGKLFLV